MNKLKSKASTAATVILCLVALALGAERIHGPITKQTVTTPTTEPATRLDSQLFYELRSGGQRIGPVNAPVNLVVFELYSCGKCAEYWSVLDSMRRRYPDHLAIVIRNYVPNLDRSNGAIMVHLAAECAADQGRFVDFVRSVFAEPAVTHVTDGWVRLGRKIGISDFSRFETCTRSHEYLARLKQDTRMGDSLKIPGTPTSFLNGFPFAGALSFAVLDSLVGSLLREPLNY